MKDLVIRESYTNNSGEEKASWNKIGVLFTGKNGKEYVKLNHIPNTLISVFEPKKKDESQENVSQENLPTNWE